jgi:WD40 repeat protein
MQELRDGRLLSWSDDKTLRIWDSQSGGSLAVLEGHTECIRGMQELRDGRLLSWSNDDMRVWDSLSGACLAVLEGQSNAIWGTQELSDGRLLSFSWSDLALRIWDSNSGECLKAVSGDEVVTRYPQCFHAITSLSSPERVVRDFFLVPYISRSFGLHYKNASWSIAVWHDDSGARCYCLSPGGIAVVRDLYFLKLHYGRHGVTFADVENMKNANFDFRHEERPEFESIFESLLEAQPEASRS